MSTLNGDHDGSFSMCSDSRGIAETHFPGLFEWDIVSKLILASNNVARCAAVNQVPCFPDNKSYPENKPQLDFPTLR